MKVFKSGALLCLLLLSGKAQALSCIEHTDQELVTRYKNIFIGYVESAEFKRYSKQDFAGNVLGKVKVFDVIKGNKVTAIKAELTNRLGTTHWQEPIRVGELLVFHTNSDDEMRLGECSPNFRFYVGAGKGYAMKRIYHYKKILGVKQNIDIELEKMLLRDHFEEKMRKAPNYYETAQPEVYKLPDDLDALRALWRKKYGPLPHERD